MLIGVLCPPPRFVLLSVSSRSSPGSPGCSVGSKVHSWVFFLILIYFFFPFLGLCGLPVRVALGLRVSGSQPGHWIRWSRSHPLLTMRLLGPPVALLHVFLVPTKMFSFLLPFQLSCCCFPRHKTANRGAAVRLRAVRSSQPAGFGV